jgi:glucose-6-phosphate isomerase
MTAPVDPTTTSAWSRLTSAATTLRPDLRGWFAADPGRVDRLSRSTAGDLHVDLSKNLMTDADRRCPRRAGPQVGLESRRDAMYRR